MFQSIFAFKLSKLIHNLKLYFIAIPILIVVINIIANYNLDDGVNFDVFFYLAYSFSIYLNYNFSSCICSLKFFG